MTSRQLPNCNNCFKPRCSIAMGLADRWCQRWLWRRLYRSVDTVPHARPLELSVPQTADIRWRHSLALRVSGSSCSSGQGGTCLTGVAGCTSGLPASESPSVGMATPESRHNHPAAQVTVNLQMENKLPLIQDWRQTDDIHDLELWPQFSVLASYGRDPCTCKKSRSNVRQFTKAWIKQTPLIGVTCPQAWLVIMCSRLKLGKTTSFTQFGLHYSNAEEVRVIGDRFCTSCHHTKSVKSNALKSLKTCSQWNAPVIKQLG